MHYKGYFLIVVFFIILFVCVIFPLPLFADTVPDQSRSSLSVNSSVPADGQTTAIVTITLRDSSNNPIGGHSVTLSDSSNSGVTITTISGTTDGNGHAIFSIKSTQAQTDNLDVTDTTVNIKFFTLGKITFTTTTCDSAPPGGTPQLTSAVAINSNRVLLTWTDAANPVTHYLVSYGLASGQYIYGDPNVGSQGTTSYTIGSLSPGKKYYFAVKAINGCTPGNFSNEISVIAGGGISYSSIAVQTPTTYVSQITGNQTTTPTDISHKNDITPTSVSILSPKMQPTTIPFPANISTVDDSKAKMYMFISISIVVVGSIGNFLYWKHKKNLQEPVN